MAAMRALHAILLSLALGLPLSATAGAGEPDAPARPRGHEDLAVDRTAHDFGVVRQNEVRRTKFTYTNTSEAVVEGIGARGECGCNVVKVSHKTLEPGASGVLDVEFSTLTLGGHMTKRVHLFSGDHTRGEILIRLKISIVQGLILRPPAVTFGTVLLGTRPRKAFYLKWYEGHGEPFEVESVEVPGYAFDTEITPYSDPRDERWGGWKIDLQFKEPPPLGMLSAEVLVRTTDADRPRVTLPLSANVSGRIWMQARTLSFGAFSQGKSRTASLKFRPLDESVQLGRVRAVARKGKVRVEVKPDPYHGKDGVWRLYGTVPEDAQPGSLDDEVIELHTEVEGEEVTVVKVRGYVRAVPR